MTMHGRHARASASASGTGYYRFVRLSGVVVVGTKTARSGVLGTWMSCNGDQTIKNGKT